MNSPNVVAFKPKSRPPIGAHTAPRFDPFIDPTEEAWQAMLGQLTKAERQAVYAFGRLLITPLDDTEGGA
jgi:hypothetical protein